MKTGTVYVRLSIPREAHQRLKMEAVAAGRFFLPFLVQLLVERSNNKPERKHHGKTK